MLEPTYIYDGIPRDAWLKKTCKYCQGKGFVFGRQCNFEGCIKEAEDNEPTCKDHRDPMSLAELADFSEGFRCAGLGNPKPYDGPEGEK